VNSKGRGGNIFREKFDRLDLCVVKGMRVNMEWSGVLPFRLSDRMISAVNEESVWIRVSESNLKVLRRKTRASESSL
jgi:calcineurin-like phosphoesterase